MALFTSSRRRPVAEATSLVAAFVLITGECSLLTRIKSYVAEEEVIGGGGSRKTRMKSRGTMTQRIIGA